MEDALVEVPFEKWPQLRDVYEKNGTISIPYFHTLQVNTKYSELKNALQLKIYCPFGDTSDGLVLISSKGHTELVIMPLSYENDKLLDAIKKTKLIDWSKNITINLLCPRAVEILKQLKINIGLKCEILPTTTFFYNKNMKPFSDINLQTDVYLAPIKLEDITQVDNSWPYKHAASHFYFSVLAKNGLSYGVYSREDDTLRAWVFFNEYYFICNLYCVEEYRRLGYGKFLVKHLVNEKMKEGGGAYALVVEGNTESFKLFKNLNFEIIEPSFYAYINKEQSA